MLFDDSQRAADTLTHWRVAMRTPIFPDDLAHNRGFKRVAKKIKQNWPFSQRLKLSAAFEILSRGLGYRNFNDVMSSKCCPLMTHAPTLAQVRDGISTSIFEYLRPECAKHLDQNTLDTLVMLLPLQELHVFRGSNPTRQLEVEALRVNHPIPQPEHSTHPFKQDCAQEVASSGVKSLSARHSKSTRVISQVLLGGLACVVKNNLREAALFTLLLSGMRSIDIVTTKVARLDDLYTSIPWQTQNSCTPGESVTSLTAKGDLARYIREAKLSVGDYLFPSERDARIPMTEGELYKIVYSWLVAARLERAQAFLLSAPLLASKEVTETLKDLTGHHAPDITSHYIRLFD